jgi:hypothetical protein
MCLADRTVDSVFEVGLSPTAPYSALMIDLRKAITIRRLSTNRSSAGVTAAPAKQAGQGLRRLLGKSLGST